MASIFAWASVPCTNAAYSSLGYAGKSLTYLASPDVCSKPSIFGISLLSGQFSLIVSNFWDPDDRGRSRTAAPDLNWSLTDSGATLSTNL
uniref:Putative secreted protein n=1 Tax=Anopheles darlingi TaxID=43151 RepID=A0A2M4DKV1_ANODA